MQPHVGHTSEKSTIYEHSKRMHNVSWYANYIIHIEIRIYMYIIHRYKSISHDGIRILHKHILEK